MSSAYYDLYLKGIFDLVGTMVVKSEITARAVNNWLRINLIEVNEGDPTTWKYYMNMAGKYHHSDTAMSVKSLDTQEVVPFTVEQLAVHRTTKREFTYKSRYYNELVEKYPDQVDLIHGIMNPVDINQAIAAKDHTILYFDQNLVESREIDLIPRLQDWIFGIYSRWDNPDYALYESLYPAAQLAILFAFMPKQILNIRLDNCKTDKAHSYHIRQYLTSFGRLDPYVDYLNNKQLLFFYRNARYLALNPGKTETFQLLTEKVMTERKFPLAEYSIRHNTETQRTTLYPAIEMRRMSINGIQSAMGKDVKTVEQVLELESTLAKANVDVQPEAEIQIPNLMKNSLYSELETKVLESNVVDLTDAQVVTLTDVTLNHWLYLACTGRYSTVFTVTNPNTGEDMYLSAKDMFALWLYSYNLARGSRLDTIPNVIAKRVRRIPLPTKTELLSIVDKDIVSDTLIEAALSNQVDVTSYISVEAFKDTCIAIHQAALRHYDLHAYRAHHVERAQVEAMVGRFYMDYTCNLGNGEPYDEWLNNRAMNLELLTEQELDQLATTVYSAATGRDIVTTKSLQDIHSAHVKLMSQLSSYSVQFIQQINTSSLMIEAWNYQRFGSQNSNGSDYIRIRETPQDILDMMVRGKPGWVSTNELMGYKDPYAILKRDVYHDLTITHAIGTTSVGKFKQRLAQITISEIDKPKVDLATIAANATPVGYPDIEFEDINGMFVTLYSPLYTSLDMRERGILEARAQ